MNPVRAAITSPKATAPLGTDPLWRLAYAFCRGMNRVACACEHNIDEPCPHLLMGAIEAEKLREVQP
jgi:hypothetical protein